MPRPSPALAVAMLAYVGSIATANALTQRYGLVDVGFGLAVTAGTFAAGFALLARDFVHTYGGVAWALAGIAAGCVVSIVVADPGLVVASAVAFTAAELTDLLVFGRLRPSWGFVSAAGLSNVVSAPVDTVLFLAIAGFPVTWATVGGQLVAKLIYATAIPLLLWIIGTRAYAVFREPDHAVSS